MEEKCHSSKVSLPSHALSQAANQDEELFPEYRKSARAVNCGNYVFFDIWACVALFIAEFGPAPAGHTRPPRYREIGL